jgi:carboxyl-terminal processing protease
LDELRKNSSDRLSKDKDFAYIREDVELVKKQRADKTISLNEAKRQQEKKETEARVEARKQERDARPAVADKVFLAKTDTVDKNLPLLAVQPPKPKDKEKPGEKSPAPKAPTDDDLDPPDTDAGKAVIDPYLRETLNILTDYAVQQAKHGRGEIVAVPRAQ